MKIHKIKSIDDLEINLPITKGLYAITGQNGSGKSTVVTCASSVFFNMPMHAYFGKTDEDASILFDLGGAKRSWKKNTADKWIQDRVGIMNIKGFYEGSIIFGNRFRNTNMDQIKELEIIDDSMLITASEFIRENLGLILHNDKNFYPQLYKLDANNLNLTIKGDIFYYQKLSRRVSQFHMSTGENLLVTVLNSMYIRNNDRASLTKPCLFFLDEIELALHPSSLRRLVEFLKKISDQYNYAIYFSTHSIELISSIRPDNIFFLERHSDNTIEIINPCYPSYATRILYDHTGYDYVILVEDDLAKKIIDKTLRNYSLLNSKLVHVLPCGGYSNVIELAREVVSSNLIGKQSKILIILDGDVRVEAEQYIAKNGIVNNIPINYLPIESLEKYLKKNLVDTVDHKLFRHLNDFVFHQVSLSDIVATYKSNNENVNDNTGKRLFGRIDNELRDRNKTRSEFIDVIIDYLFNNNILQVQPLLTFLKKQLR